jgi:hypothetical protein
MNLFSCKRNNHRHFFCRSTMYTNKIVWIIYGIVFLAYCCKLSRRCARLRCLRVNELVGIFTKEISSLSSHKNISASPCWIIIAHCKINQFSLPYSWTLLMDLKTLIQNQSCSLSFHRRNAAVNWELFIAQVN